jgi:hypothetical protein
MGTKRHISAKAVLADIKAGLSEAALMEKYQLSPERLKAVFDKLASAGLLSPRNSANTESSLAEITVEGYWKCPACGSLREYKPTVCPDCGVIVDKARPRLAENDVELRPRKSSRLYALLGLAAVVITAICLLPENKDSAVLKASREGNTDEVQRLLLKGASHRATTENGETPLILAAANGRVSTAKRLLNQAYEARDFEYVQARDTKQATAMIYAAENGHEEVVRVLLDRRAKVDAPDSEGKSPLIRAATRGHSAVVKVLLEKGANYEKKDRAVLMAVDYAKANGHYDVVAILQAKEAAEARKRQAEMAAEARQRQAALEATTGQWQPVPTAPTALVPVNRYYVGDREVSAGEFYQARQELMDAEDKEYKCDCIYTKRFPDGDSMLLEIPKTVYDCKRLGGRCKNNEVWWRYCPPPRR